jgi:hypothetical protein
MMVFVPARRDDARWLRDQPTAMPSPDEANHLWLGHAATPALMAAHEYDAALQEDAEYVALCYAGVRALWATGDRLRLVLAVEVPSASVLSDPPDAYGLVRCTELAWARVAALFSDDAEAASAVSAARAVAGSEMPLDRALQVAEVAHVLDDHELLWFAPEELDRLPQ